MRGVCFAGMLGLILTGCGGSSGPELVQVSGTVTYQGEPINDGAIRFIPVDDSEAPMRSVVIKEGKYNASDRSALGVGTYRVEVESYIGEVLGPGFLPVSDPESAKNAPKPQEQILPEKFNKQTEIEQFTVPPDSEPITKNYELK